MVSSNKKEIIREAAIKVISSMGFYNTKTASIAEEAGVAVGTIYNYFKSKEDILEYIFFVEFEKRLNYLQDVKQKNLPVFDKLLLFLEKHFEEVRNNPELGRILVREKEFPRKKENAAIAGYLNRLPALIEEILKQAIEKGELKPVDTRITSAAIFGAVQGIVEKAVTQGEIDLLDIAAREVITLLKGEM